MHVHDFDSNDGFLGVYVKHICKSIYVYVKVYTLNMCSLLCIKIFCSLLYIKIYQ